MSRPVAGFGHYLRDMVYGALDGVITTMAVLAGAEGASLSLRVGLILGMAESYTAGYWPGSAGTRWTDLVIFVILIAFMIFRPQGLFGRPDIKKV